MIYIVRTPDDLISTARATPWWTRVTTSIRPPFEGPATDGPTVVVLKAAGL